MNDGFLRYFVPHELYSGGYTSAYAQDRLTHAELVSCTACARK